MRALLQGREEQAAMNSEGLTGRSPRSGPCRSSVALLTKTVTDTSHLFEYGVDAFGVSFVETADDIRKVKDFAQKRGCRSDPETDGSSGVVVVVPHGFMARLEQVHDDQMDRFGPFVGYYFRMDELHNIGMHRKGHI